MSESNQTTIKEERKIWRNSKEFRRIIGRKKGRKKKISSNPKPLPLEPPPPKPKLLSYVSSRRKHPPEVRKFVSKIKDGRKSWTLFEYEKLLNNYRKRAIYHDNGCITFHSGRIREGYRFSDAKNWSAKQAAWILFIGGDSKAPMPEGIMRSLPDCEKGCANFIHLEEVIHFRKSPNNRLKILSPGKIVDICNPEHHKKYSFSSNPELYKKFGLPGRLIAFSRMYPEPHPVPEDGWPELSFLCKKALRCKKEPRPWQKNYILYRLEKTFPDHDSPDSMGIEWVKRETFYVRQWSMIKNKYRDTDSEGVTKVILSKVIDQCKKTGILPKGIGVEITWTPKWKENPQLAKYRSRTSSQRWENPDDFLI